jgi:hypothetical protein
LLEYAFEMASGLGNIFSFSQIAAWRSRGFICSVYT